MMCVFSCICVFEQKPTRTEQAKNWSKTSKIRVDTYMHEQMNALYSVNIYSEYIQRIYSDYSIFMYFQTLIHV